MGKWPRCPMATHEARIKRNASIISYLLFMPVPHMIQFLALLTRRVILQTNRLTVDSSSPVEDPRRFASRLQFGSAAPANRWKLKPVRGHTTAFDETRRRSTKRTR